MTASVPWSVNAVEPDTWATAREAARRSGVSVGEWLEAAIRETAGEINSARGAKRPSGDRLERRLDDLTEQLDHFMREGPRGRGDKRTGRDEGALVHSLEALTQRIDTLIGDVRSNEEGAPRRIKTAIDKLDHRLETLFTQSRSTASAREPEIERKLSDIARTIEAMSQRIEQENTRYVAPMASPSIAELDAAIAEITVRQASLDQGVRPEDLEKRLTAIDKRFGLGRAGPDLKGLEHQLKTMADEMQALRRESVQAESIEVVRREVAELARTLSELAPRRSIETLERTIEALARRIDQNSRGGADENAGEIIDALTEIKGALADVRPAENFSAVERDLQSLSSKLDQLNARGIDSATVDRLQAQAGEIRELLASALPSDALKLLVGQIEMLVHKFENAASPGEGAVLDVVSALGRRIDTFADRVETASRQPAGGAVLDEIKNRLEQIEGALSRGDRGETGGLEATMKSLVDKLAAAEMRLSSLGNLERGLNDLFGQIHEVRANAIDVAERAMRSASPAPAKLSEIQERRDAEPEARFAPMPAPTPRSTEAKPEPVSISRAPSIQALPRPIADDPETASVTSASEEGSDLPLEPGSGFPRGQGSQSAAQRVAQSEAALGGIVSKLPENSVRTSDFIAAARRAAQAAAAEQNGPAPAKKESKISMPGKPAGKRALFIGLMAILLIFGAVRFSGAWMPIFFHAAPPAPPPADTPQDESVPVEKQSFIPVESDSAIASAPPSGVVGPAPASSLLAKPETDAEPTGSIKNAKPTKATIEGAAAPAREPAELPSSIGTPALRAAAMATDPTAAYEIGSRWFEGRGVQMNAVEARRWFEIALAKSSMPAAYRLGSLYEKGHGVPKNSAEARRYYTLAAEAGHAKAMHNLAVLYSEGVDGKPDYKAAARWFRMAAERNVRDSQYNLGVLYARGFGVDQNMAESFRWFALAATQGDADAAKKRDDIAGRLDAQTLIAAKLAVQTWTATPLDEAANNIRLKPEWEKAEAAAPRKRAIKN